MSSKKGKGDPGPRKPRFPELPPKYSSSRELRNKAEKMRRDRLNKLIEEIRSLVPIICTRTKKSETTRSNILRLTANFLRVQKLFPQEEEGKSNGEGSSGHSSPCTAVAPLSQASAPPVPFDGLPHLESMEGFFFLLAEDGRILFISENVDKFIGFNQIDLMGHNVSNFCHPADATKITSILAAKRASSAPGTPSPGPASALSLPGAEEEEPRQSFYLRLKEKPLAKNDSAQYEHLHVVGRRRRVGTRSKGGLLCNFTFVGVMRPVRDRPITELSLVESVQDQYITRHLPDGRIIYADHRIATIAGFLPGEVQGKSAFNFFNAEDLPWTTMAMRHMFASSNGEGSTTYRLMTSTGQYICLQTKGYLEYNRTTNKIETFICINTVVRGEDEEKFLNEQKERFSPFITEVQINQMKQSRSYVPGVSNTTKPAIGYSSSPSTVTSPPSPTSLPSLLSPSPTLPSPSPLHSPSSDLRSLKRSLSPHPVTSHNKRPALSPPAPSMNQGSKRGHGGEVTEARGSSIQYHRRSVPQHRVEEGHRVVDIYEYILPILNGELLPQEGAGPSVPELNFSGVIRQHNEALRLREAPPLPGLELDLGMASTDLQDCNHMDNGMNGISSINSIYNSTNCTSYTTSNVNTVNFNTPFTCPSPPKRASVISVNQQRQEDRVDRRTEDRVDGRRAEDRVEDRVEGRTKEDLIAEKLRLLAAPRSSRGGQLLSLVEDEGLLSIHPQDALAEYLNQVEGSPS